MQFSKRGLVLIACCYHCMLFCPIIIIPCRMSIFPIFNRTYWFPIVPIYTKSILSFTSFLGKPFADHPVEFPIRLIVIIVIYRPEKIIPMIHTGFTKKNRTILKFRRSYPWSCRNVLLLRRCTLFGRIFCLRSQKRCLYYCVAKREQRGFALNFILRTEKAYHRIEDVCKW